MDFTIDASEVTAFAGRLGGVQSVIAQAVADGTNALLVEGVGLAQEAAPVDEGTLRGSIAIIRAASAGDPSGEYGTSLVYAWMREEGGTITGNPWLVFQVDGRWVKVRSVTQSGSHYMAQSVAGLEGRVDAVYGAALDRALGAL
jgi:hypothetical protein